MLCLGCPAFGEGHCSVCSFFYGYEYLANSGDYTGKLAIHVKDSLSGNIYGEEYLEWREFEEV